MCGVVCARVEYVMACRWLLCVLVDGRERNAFFNKVFGGLLPFLGPPVAGAPGSFLSAGRKRFVRTKYDEVQYACHTWLDILYDI